MKIILFLFFIPLFSFSQGEYLKILTQLLSDPIEQSIELYSDSDHSEIEPGKYLFLYKDLSFILEEMESTATLQVPYEKLEFNKTRKWLDQNFEVIDLIKDKDELQISYDGDNKFWSLFHYTDDYGEWMMLVCISEQ